MTRAMILCAGFGTRLGPLTSDRPKPWLPVADIPIVRYCIAMLVGHGIRDLVINLHHCGAGLAGELGDGAALGARIQYSWEEEILGTGGGIKRALPLLDPTGTDDPIVVMNGKLIIDADIDQLLATYRQTPKALAALLVKRTPRAQDWGAVQVDGASRVRNILGEGSHMFCGVHVTRPSVVAGLPDGEACMVRQGYLPWIQSGRGEVLAVEHDRYFAEHSTLRRYLEGNFAVLDGAKLRYPPGPASGVAREAEIAETARLVPPVLIGKGARVGENATVGPHTVVGAGATIGPGCQVTRSVLWPGIELRESVDETIATPTGTYEAEPGDQLD